MLRTVAIAALLVSLSTSPHAHAQAEGAPDRAQFAGMQRGGGEITTITPGKLTVKTEDGATLTITTTDNTRIMKGRGVTIKFADLHVGDAVGAAGNLDAPNKTLHAAILFFISDAAQLKALRDNLGKTYIAGKVTAIDLDNARMTVERPDKVNQVIAFDDSTSFKRATRGGGGQGFGGGGFGGGAANSTTPAAETGESITLADIKIGDTVRGQGSVHGGTFIPTQLIASTPRPRPNTTAAQPQ